MYIKGYVHAVLNFYIEIYSPKFSGSRIIFHLLLKISDDVITLTKLFFFLCVWVFGKGRGLEGNEMLRFHSEQVYI